MRRRQGARTDLVGDESALSLTATAEAMRDAGDDRHRLGLFFEFCRGADEVGVAALPLVADEPPATGDSRFDALLAAIAEHISSRYGLAGPLWSVAADRFLDTGWWVSMLPSARIHAMLWAPAAFRRRGVYLDRHDLTHDGVAAVPEPLFDLTELRRAVGELAESLARRGVVGQVHVFGGAAMILAYDATRVATRDIDALFTPDGPMVAAIHEVARVHGWPSSWLNNQASGYVSREPGSGSRVFDHPYLQVVATPPRHLLAMKVLAARAVRDGEDIRVLLAHLGISTAVEVWTLVERFFPGAVISERSRLLVEDLVGGHETGT